MKLNTAAQKGPYKLAFQFSHYKHLVALLLREEVLGAEQAELWICSVWVRRYAELSSDRRTGCL